MRVVHVVTNLELAGTQTSVVDICAGLVGAGHDVHIVYSSRGGRAFGDADVLHARATAAGIQLHDVPSMRRAIAPVGDAAAVIELLRLFRRLAPDVVHTHASKAGVLGRAAARAAGVPVVLHSVRGWSFYAAPPGPLRWLAIACERWAARLSVAQIAVSRAVAADGLRAGIGADRPYVVIRSGIDLAAFARPAAIAARADLGIPAGATVVGAVLALVPAKAPLDLVAVARRLLRSGRDVHVVVAGDGPLRPALTAAIAGAGLAGRFHLLGARRDVAALYPLFDVVVLPSRWEGLPRVAVEAVAAGVPVVATDVGGVGEVVIPGVTGRLVCAGDVAGLADAVLAVLADPRLAVALRAAAPALLDGFELGRVIADHERVYRALAARTP